NVTRGQISKMVAEAFEFNEPVQGQSFQDVPTNSTFYEYIERLAARGILSGYACGGTSEPCGASGKPYFRPNANVTRRQAAKIVYGAQQDANQSATPTQTQVPATATTAATATRTATATSTSIIPPLGSGSTSSAREVALNVYNAGVTPSQLRRNS
ncbi:MAG TPA: S-layer homology domain-containing protein, partial [Chloroflexia bacterium]|nr:S-layer homology domain-containing protein [Chloroflexia bacterium]